MKMGREAKRRFPGREEAADVVGGGGRRPPLRRGCREELLAPAPAAGCAFKAAWAVRRELAKGSMPAKLGTGVPAVCAVSNVVGGGG